MLGEATQCILIRRPKNLPNASMHKVSGIFNGRPARIRHSQADHPAIELATLTLDQSGILKPRQRLAQERPRHVHNGHQIGQRRNFRKVRERCQNLKPLARQALLCKPPAQDAQELVSCIHDLKRRLQSQPAVLSGC